MLCISALSNGQEQLKKLDYIKNLGQWDRTVQYKLNLKGGRIFFHNNSLTYDFQNLKDIHEVSEKIHHSSSKVTEGESVINCFSYKVNFLNANDTKFEGIEKKEHYHNYLLGNDSTKWASFVPLYSSLYGKNIYKNIDIKTYSSNGNFKYDFIIHKGGNVSDIQLDFEGVQKIKLFKENLIIKTSFDKVIEQKPYVYQIIDEVKIEIKASYKIIDNVVTYEVGAYNKNYDLIIDPTVIASTYSGSTEGIYGHTATYDDNGNIYSGGAGFSPGGLPVTTGAYQTTYVGNREMCINKYNQIGSSLIYATYLGGANDDFPHSLIDFNGNLYILGSSLSENYPITAGAYQSVKAGSGGAFPPTDSDIVISILNPTGSNLLGSTYLGGTEDDGLNIITPNYGDEYRGEIMVDATGNCYIASMSSSTDFPTTASAVQSTHGGGGFASPQDGIVVKLNSNLSTLLFSTYLGGSGNNAAYGIIVEGTKIYVTGSTEDGFLNATGGAFPTYLGGSDCFVIELDANASNILNATYFGIAGQDEQSFFIEADLSGNIYILGQSNGAIPSTPGAYSAGGNQIFITKFNNTLTNRIYTSTGPGMAPVAFLVDNCGYIYASGHEASFSSPVTSDAIQSTFAGFYLMILNPTATGLKFGTYYGDPSSHVDGGTSRFSKNGTVYQATCTDTGFPTLPGAFSPTNMTGFDYDVTVFKIDFGLDSIIAQAIPSPDTIGCAPLLVNFNNTSGGDYFIWDFGDGSPTENTINPSHTFNNIGTYTVRLIAEDTSSFCGTSDTIYINIKVIPSITLAITPDTTICANASIQLMASGGSSYVWSPVASLDDPNIANPIATPTTTTTYQVISGTGTCADTGFVTITVDSTSVTISNDTNICIGDSASLQATGGTSYSWYPIVGITNPNSPTVPASPSVTTTYYVDITTDCGIVTDSVLVTVYGGPIVTSPDTSICLNDSVQLMINGGSNYVWYPAASLNNPNISNPIASPTAPTTYQVISSNVCKTDTAYINVGITPIITFVSNDTLICLGDSTTLQAGGGSDYAWYTNGGTINTGYSITVSPLVTTTYYVDINTSCGIVTDSILVTIPTSTIITSSDTTICPDDSVKLMVSGGSNYTWSPAATLSNPNIPNPIASPLTTTTYQVISNNACNNDTGYVTISLLIKDTNTSVSNDTLICSGTPITLSAFGGTSYMWSSSNNISFPASSSISINPNATSIYYVDITATCDIIRDSVKVTTQKPVAIISPNDTICLGDSSILWANGGVTYNWTPSNQVLNPGDDTTIAFPLSPTSFRVIIADDLGCLDTAYTAIFFPNSFIDAGPDKTIIFGEGVDLVPYHSIGTVYWNNDSSLSCLNCEITFASPDDATVFTVNLIDKHGCVVSDEVLVSVTGVIYVPNTFSPNSDGVNDMFYVKGKNIEKFELFIFDRWGELLFSTNNIFIGWDGKYKDEDVQTDTYVWKLKYSDVKTKNKQLHGHLNVIR